MKLTGHGEDEHSGPRGTICLLPSLLTTVSLFSGFYAIIAAINGDFLTAAVAILVSGIFDGLDGRVARLTGTASQFGMEYDSLCDLVAFGVAPAVLAYLWTLQGYGRYGWLAAFLYVATTALRLARFNTLDATAASKEFTGLPCPAAAGMIATTVLFCLFVEASGQMKDFSILVMVYFLSYLMVSTHKYLSFKHPETKKAKAFQVLVGMVLVIILIATKPEITLFGIALIYMLSGPLNDLYQLLFKRKKAIGKADKPV